MGPATPAAPGRPQTRGPGRVIAVANLKGGTGKSTIAVNLACLAAQVHGEAVLVDADPQGTSAAWLDEAEAAGRPAGLVVEARPLVGPPEAWAEEVFRLGQARPRVVIDMPPQLGPGFDAVLQMVDVLLIPVTPSAIDLRATARTLQRLKKARQQRAERPACLLVPNRVDQRTAVGRTIQRALRDLQIGVTPPVAQRSGHATAFSARQWIGAHAPGSPAHRELAAVAAALEKLLSTCPANDYVGAPLALGPASVAVQPPHPAPERERGGILATLLAGLRQLGRPQAGLNRAGATSSPPPR